jgi:cell division septum initiation protein DivIVA
MSDFDRPGATLPSPVKHGQIATRFANLGDRLARTFGAQHRPANGLHDWDEADDFTHAEHGVTPPPWDAVGPRFPIARHGYDREAVDEHVAQLERELSELQTSAATATAIAEEIDRIGEQTSAILTVAHDQAQDMTRQAQEQADRCLADAAANAVMITEDAKRRLQQLDTDTDAVWQERARLVDDVREVAGALLKLAEDATERFPAEAAKPDPAPVAAAAVVEEAVVEEQPAAPEASGGEGPSTEPVAAPAEPSSQETAPFNPFEPEDD